MFLINCLHINGDIKKIYRYIISGNGPEKCRTVDLNSRKRILKLLFSDFPK